MLARPAPAVGGALSRGRGRRPDGGSVNPGTRAEVYVWKAENWSNN